MKKFNKKIVTTLVIASLVIASFVLGFVGLNSAYAVTPPDRGLGIADSYGVFGKAAVTNDGASTTIWGDVGADATSSITGLDDATQVDGTINGLPEVDGVQTAAGSTYDSLMSASQQLTLGIPQTLNLAGTNTIGPGIYNVAASTLNGALTLDGAGVYIFRSSSSNTTAHSGTMNLINGACASNVFWAISTSMDIGTGAHVEGTIIASTGSITFGTGATLVGRAISLTQQVTLLGNQITEPICALPNLTVIKEVVGGSKLATDFPLFIRDVSTTTTVSATTGVTATTTAGTYVVTETTDSNYTQTFSASCPGGNITLFSGQNATCTITNTYITSLSSYSSGGFTHYGCKDVNALNYEYFAASNPALCVYTATSTIISPVVATTTVTTTVFIPKLPNTGLPPKESTPWNIIVLSSILMLVSASLIVVLRKRRV